MLIDKAIEINRENVKMLTGLCKGLKQNIKNMQKSKVEGETEISDKNYTKIGIDYKSYYVIKKSEVNNVLYNILSRR